MRSCVILAVAVCVFSGHVSAVISAESQSVTSSEVLAERVVNLIDQVVDRHIDPPTRQAMIHETCKRLGGASIAAIGLGRQVTSADEAELLSLLKQLIKKFPESERESSVNQTLANVLRDIADTQLELRDERKVNDQIAANRYVGIGIALSQNAGRSRMAKVFEGGAADKAGAEQGDYIVKVDGVGAAGKSIKEVVSMLRGLSGSEVKLTIQKENGEERDCTLTRAIVPFKHVKDFRVLDRRIAVVTVEAVTGSIERDLRALTPTLKEANANGLVIELKANQANYRSALLLANSLIDAGPIGRLISRRDTLLVSEEIKAEPGQLWPRLQIVLAVSSVPRGPLAWAIEGIKAQPNIEVMYEYGSRPDVQQEVPWKEETIDSRIAEFVLTVPTARLVSIGSDIGNDISQANVATRLMMPSGGLETVAEENRLLMSMRRRNASSPKFKLIDRSINAMRERINEGQ